MSIAVPPLIAGSDNIESLRPYYGVGVPIPVPPIILKEMYAFLPQACDLREFSPDLASELAVFLTRLIDQKGIDQGGRPAGFMPLQDLRALIVSAVEDGNANLRLSIAELAASGRRLETTFAEFDARLGTVKTDVNDVKKEIKAMSKELKAVKAEQAILKKGQETLRKGQETLRKGQETLEGKVDGLKDECHTEFKLRKQERAKELNRRRHILRKQLFHVPSCHTDAEHPPRVHTRLTSIDDISTLSEADLDAWTEYYGRIGEWRLDDSEGKKIWLRDFLIGNA
ncbi:hypothetical protein TREMEDRAFT_66290 [Tremella mesenterica DSM 1558]|uniref:uncharacterized protein n=1 Tax=Tremella mesenterica (strain ATCC 24925 / CBS 8224 / DSM 1558 / NBRC 9311 / NRRL Y-6157 / RJB 2259-6 / UBC 559-6) TaxID=578456 RepID=UPI00032C1487|nr:uncharacterized protein TREMEDRAFT_66290 [Tremella mesenterica DSM 1558]EIW65692.1 hypothetical protein TREMEDRAFT_66290 [Tremella mesenterica DSM 1558]